MSKQSAEIIKYRGLSLKTFAEPFYDYLKLKGNNNEYLSSAKTINYQGYWEIKDNKFYITNIESNHFKYENIFNTKEPILAEWYTGEIEIGIGNYSFDDYSIYYENYLILTIENGIIINRKIVKKYFDMPIMQFGKYKGIDFNKILFGKFFNYYEIVQIVNEYLNGLLQFLTDNNYNYKFTTPNFKIEEKDIELVKYIRKRNKIKYLITQTYIATTSTLQFAEPQEDSDAIKLSSLLEKILSSDFRNLIVLNKANLGEHTKISDSSLLLNHDLEYIKWTICNLDYYFVPPSLIDKLMCTTRLIKFDINRLNPTIFEYKPIIEQIDFKIPENIIELNTYKFEVFTNLKYNKKLNLYEYNLTNYDLYKMFGFYLDEKYVTNDDFVKYDCIKNTIYNKNYDSNTQDYEI